MAHNFEDKGNFEVQLKPVCGSTYYIDLGGMAITGYRLSGTEMILLDCGVGYSDVEALIAKLDSLGMTVPAVICSHCHVDHIGGAAKLKACYGTEVWAPELEAACCTYPQVLKSNYPFTSLNSVMKFFPTMLSPIDHTYPPEDTEIEIRGAVFQIVYTPGHSVANACIITPDNVMHMGDTVISRWEMEHSRLIYTFLIDQDMESKERVRDFRCEAYVAVHKGLFGPGEIDELVDDNIDYFRQAAANIEALLDEPRSIDGLIEAFYDTYGLNGSNRITCSLIERSIRPYVDYLWDQGRLSAVCEKGVVKYRKKDGAP